MVGRLLLRGMLAGAVAGLLAFGFARVFGEPSVAQAIAFEDAISQAAGEAAEPELVSRAVQAGLGLFTGIVVFGAAVGGLLSLAFALCYGRLTTLGPRGMAALLALGGFVALVLVPGLKYPPNPPAVGDAETIAYRTQMFFILLLASLVAMGGAVALARQLWSSLGAWSAALSGAAAYGIVMVLVDLALPTINEVPEQFPATLLWQFRTGALGIQLVLWTALGLLFGAAAERLLVPGRVKRAVALGRV